MAGQVLITFPWKDLRNNFYDAKKAGRITCRPETSRRKPTSTSHVPSIPDMEHRLPPCRSLRFGNVC